jgi:uncharacterized radical SAM superfamily Fe-S cluster-containing enzyme
MAIIYLLKKVKKLLRKSIYKLFLCGLLPKKWFSMGTLVFITGQGCTLKCRNCANFSPYLAKKYPFYKYEDIINDLDIMTRNIKIRNKIQIQGGEFLIHPKLLDIIKYVKQNQKIPLLSIATNRTVVPSNEVLKEMVGIEFRISNYPRPPSDVNSSHLFDNTRKLITKLTEYGYSL